MAVAPPTTLAGRLAQLGPGLIISAAIVGSGELIVIPKLGAAMGFTLLWFVILGCVLKVFVQVELARHAIAHQETTLVSLDTIPGPRWRVSWVLWAWMLMYAGTVLQVGGIIGGITMICGMLGLNWPPWVWLVLTTGSGIALLVSGRYGPVERYSTAMVAIFTLSAMVAVVALQWTEFHVTAAQWREGLSLHMPDSFTIAFAAFGVTGVGASELIYYPYWCLEKGYGLSVGPPPPGGARSPQRPAWTAGALGWLRVMRLDAFVSMIIYTFATIAFYVLGAAILHQTARDVSDNDLIGRLADMYLRSLGEWSYVLFLVGALAVLYSTFFVATASNARLLVDVGGLLGVPAAAAPTAEARRKAVQAACVLLPLASATAYVVWPQPVTLVLIGAVGQGIMLPLLAVAAVYFRHKRLPPDLAPSTGWTVALWISAGLMTLVGLYQLLRTIGAI
jgi:Mn2+/Fe2+ NRAMP family transporter